MNLEKQLTSVTQFSKNIAAVLFVTLPLIGFWLGIEYQKSITPIFDEQVLINRMKRKLVNVDETANWKTYIHEKPGFEFKYPDNLEMFVTDNANPDRPFYYFHLGLIPRGGDETSGNLITLTASNQFKTLNEHLNNTWCPSNLEDCANSDQVTSRILSENPAKEIIADNGFFEMHRVISQKDNFIFELNVILNKIHEDFYNKEERELLFSQILSTFRFLDEEDIIKKPLSSSEVKLLCEQNNGKFLYELNEKNKYMECENITEQSCISTGGTFDECASSCRHVQYSPNMGMCDLECVPVCRF